MKVFFGCLKESVSALFTDILRVINVVVKARQAPIADCSNLAAIVKGRGCEGVDWQ